MPLNKETTSNNVVVWTVSILRMISDSFNLFSQISETSLSVPTIIGITVTSSTLFFSSQARSKYLSIISFYFILTRWSTRTSKSIRWQVLFLVNTRPGLLAWIKWSVSIRWQVLFLVNTRPGLLAWIKWSVSIRWQVLFLVNTRPGLLAWIKWSVSIRWQVIFLVNTRPGLLAWINQNCLK